MILSEHSPDSIVSSTQFSLFSRIASPSMPQRHGHRSTTTNWRPRRNEKRPLHWRTISWWRIFFVLSVSLSPPLFDPLCFSLLIRRSIISFPVTGSSCNKENEQRMNTRWNMKLTEEGCFKPEKITTLLVEAEKHGHSRSSVVYCYCCCYCQSYAVGRQIGYNRS